MTLSSRFIIGRKDDLRVVGPCLFNGRKNRTHLTRCLKTYRTKVMSEAHIAKHYPIVGEWGEFTFYDYVICMDDPNWSKARLIDRDGIRSPVAQARRYLAPMKALKGEVFERRLSDYYKLKHTIALVATVEGVWSRLGKEKASVFCHRLDVRLAWDEHEAALLALSGYELIGETK